MLINRFLAVVDRLSDAAGLSVPAIVDADQLRSLPAHTLGYAWIASLEDHRLTPFTTGPRRKQLHDGVHVLTGYGIDPIGEAEVQAFLLGATFRLTHLILGLGILRLIWRQCPHLSQQEVQQRLWQAYQRGHRSTFDLDTWQPEVMWHLPLAHIQQMYGL